MKKKISKHSIIIFITSSLLVIVIFNIYDLYTSYQRQIANHQLSTFGQSGFMELNNKTKNNISFLKTHIPAGAVCYLWADPRHYDTVITECKAFEMGYFLYPTSIKVSPEKLKTPYDFIISEKSDFEDLQLYLTFFDMKKDFAKIAENEKLIILESSSVSPIGLRRSGRVKLINY